MKEEFITKNFENSLLISGKFFYADRHTDGGTEIVILTVEFHNFVRRYK